MLKVIGFLFLFSASITVCRAHHSLCREKLVLCEEMVRFIAFIRLRISCYLEPVDVAAREFSSELFDKHGLSMRIRDEGVLRTFSELLHGIPLPREVGRLLVELSGSLGTGYVDDELRIIDGYSEQLVSIMQSEREKIPKENKLITTLVSGATLGVIILFL
jgi:hypothetical protein